MASKFSNLLFSMLCLDILTLPYS